MVNAERLLLDEADTGGVPGRRSGIRSVSRWHAEHPYVIKVGDQEYRTGYIPVESDTGMFGGNSNWRGPVWFPVNVMLLRALLNLYVFFGDSFTVEYPTGSGQRLNLYEVARLVSCLPADAERAAAAAIATLPGATMWHEGQFEGRRVRPPVLLSRRPDEAPDLELAGWYRRSLAAVDDHQVRVGAWRLLEASGWPDNHSCANLAAWSWAGDRGGDRYLLVVNLSGRSAQARIPLDWPDLPGRSWQLTDILGQSVFERDGAELSSSGLFVDLGPWQFHLFARQ